MHLVFLNQYYPPDAAPTGVMLQAVAEECARQGHEVTVICAAGGYAGGAVNIEHRTSNIEHRSEERTSVANCSGSSTPNNQKSKIHNHQSSIPTSSGPQRSTINHQPSAFYSPHILRLPATRFGRGTFVGKLADYASYYLGVAWRLGTMDPKPDRIVALTTPPYLSMLARAVSKLRGADHAHWVMDLYPDVMVAHGMLAQGGWKHRLLAGLARWGFGGRRCAAVLTLGPDMAERVGRLNIEHRTSNIERRSEENGSGASVTVADCSSFDSSNHQLSTLNSRLSTISWVPLWGGERANVEHRTLNIERRSEENCSGASATVADCPSSGSSIQHPDSNIQNSPSPSLRGNSPGDQQSAINNHQSAISSPSIQHPTSNIQNPSTSLRACRGWGPDELVVMYSGNMGLGHRFGEILEVARHLNVEHRTSNIEHRSGEVRGVADFPRGKERQRDESEHSSSLQNPKSTINNQQSSIPPSSSNSQLLPPPLHHSPSGLNSPLSSTDTSLGGMNESQDESRDPFSPSSNSQLSTSDSQLPQKHRFVFYGGGKRRGGD